MNWEFKATKFANFLHLMTNFWLVFLQGTHFLKSQKIDVFSNASSSKNNSYIFNQCLTLRDLLTICRLNFQKETQTRMHALNFYRMLFNWKRILASLFAFLEKEKRKRIKKKCFLLWYICSVLNLPSDDCHSMFAYSATYRILKDIDMYTNWTYAKASEERLIKLNVAMEDEKRINFKVKHNLFCLIYENVASYLKCTYNLHSGLILSVKKISR